MGWARPLWASPPPFATHLYASSYDKAVFTSSRKPSQLVHHTLPAPSLDFSSSNLNICAHHPTLRSIPWVCPPPTASPSLGSNWLSHVPSWHQQLLANGLGTGVASGTSPAPLFTQLPFLSAPSPARTHLMHLFQTLISNLQPFDHLHFNLGELYTLDLRMPKQTRWSGACLPHLLLPPLPAPPTIVSRLVIWFSVLSRSCSRYRFFLSSSLARLQREPAR